ncbi:beta-lactamase [Capsaspora owczarzaki ATCC 30864]|uniref:Beta-lactamase n=1 Tax=Capsaspora owczarzaki (strain ATCC 30864) TaxID=595528 RepID=A0A0D2X115_CAPO3|nr:beta-lactamase [Capsaspora owczarzaki ATCC 30864]KJE90019.1 beta-lactamase [Capsaspora owczarzaki ATCC 30864]|eukprot:XP_011270084.1 beta-lactamase [Capsaspora owczarzaki ATCC 30864]
MQNAPQRILPLFCGCLLLLGALVLSCRADSAAAALPHPSVRVKDRYPFAVGAAVDWSPVDAVLDSALASRVFPGAVAAVVAANGIVYLRALGNQTYDNVLPPFAPSGSTGSPPMHPTTKFDLASLTKVLASTTAAMTLYQRGLLDLDMAVADPSLLTDAFAAQGKQTVTVRNLMLHNAGFPPDPSPEYWDVAFGCKQTTQPFAAEVFDCREQIFQSVLNQTLANPVGQVYVYSDLSMITMKFVIGRIARDHGLVTEQDLLPACAAAGGDPHATISGRLQCYYEAYVRLHVIDVLRLGDTGFLPPRADYARIAPTWNDTWYRHIQLQGVVSDGNSYALGGIAGHAGLFSTAVDIAVLVHSLLFAEPNNPWINSTTVALFTKVYNATQSPRALGWSTNLDLTCGALSPTTFTHTGYTGTQVCNDPELGFTTILLTNRCYPNDTAESMTQIAATRKAYSSAVQQVWLASRDVEN